MKDIQRAIEEAKKMRVLEKAEDKKPKPVAYGAQRGGSPNVVAINNPWTGE